LALKNKQITANTVKDMTGATPELGYVPIYDKNGNVAGQVAPGTDLSKTNGIYSYEKPGTTPAYDVRTRTGLWEQPKDSTRTYDSTQAPSGYKYMYDEKDERIAVPMNSQEVTNAKLDQASTDFQSKTTQLLNGTYPLTEGQKAQMASLERQFQDLISKQKVANANYEGVITRATGLSGESRYSPDQAAGRIVQAVTEGTDKIMGLQTKMAGALAELQQGFQSDNYDIMSQAYDKYTEAQKDIQKNIDTVQKNAQDAMDMANEAATDAEVERQKGITDILEAATKSGAPESVKTSILASKNKNEAILAAGEYLAGATGMVGEYSYYKRQEEAAGRTPVSFDEYQDIDANRKRSIAAAAVGPTGLSSKEVTVFNGLVDKYNKSPLVAANDRAAVLRAVSSELEKDPTNATLQLSFIYSFIQALDTYQSAVREGEITLVSSTQGLADKLAVLPEKLQKGTILNEKVVKQYLGTQKVLTDAIQAAADKKLTGFRKQASLAGVGEAFDEYAQAVKEDTSMQDMGNVEETAKAELINIGKRSVDNQQLILKLSTEKEPTLGRPMTYSEIREYLQATGKI